MQAILKQAFRLARQALKADKLYHKSYHKLL
nr:MAG TPA: hypothetical protein [Caudoviricetes sp.]